MSRSFPEFREILFQEIVPAMGCTEPIAIAYAAAKASELLQAVPEQICVYCSGNIIKNVKAVVVPNSGGLKGIEVAAALGAVIGDCSRQLEILAEVTDDQRQRALSLIDEKRITVSLVEDEEKLFIRIVASSRNHNCEVVLRNNHRNFYRLILDGQIIYDDPQYAPSTDNSDVSREHSDLPDSLSLDNILTFVEELDLASDIELRQTILSQVETNQKIAEEGLNNDYGMRIGKTVLATANASTPEVLAKAYAAAGSDARMSGCNLPVVINCGSGNQGITVSLPVYAYYLAKKTNYTVDQLVKSLIVANLMAVHQKRFIGRLSAFCGIVSAAAAAGSGIGYLLGMDREKIAAIIINTIATSGGMVCDGAKPSCAAKIAICIDNMNMAIALATDKRRFCSGDGIVGDTVEDTIRNVGRMAREGMRDTDVEILQIMLGQ